MVLMLLLGYLAYFIFSPASSDGHVASVVMFYQLAGHALVNGSMPSLVANVLLPLFDFQLTGDSGADASVTVCPFKGLSTLQKLALNFLLPGTMFALLLIVSMFKAFLQHASLCAANCK